jgi:hypothetical protein
MSDTPHTSKSNIVKDHPRKFMGLAVLMCFAAAGEPITTLAGIALFGYSFFAWLDYRRWDAAEAEKYRREDEARRADMRIRY